MKRLGLIAVAALILLALGLLSSIATQGFSDLAAARAERARLEARKAELEVRISEFEATLKAVRSDPAAVESIARSELGWIRPDETIILLTTPTPATIGTAEPGPTPTAILRMP